MSQSKTYCCYIIIKVKQLSHVQLFVTPWTVAQQAPLSMGFSKQQDRSGLPFPSPGDLPDPGIEPRSPTLQTDALLSKPYLIISTELKEKHTLQSLSEVTQSCPTPCRPHGLQPTRLLCPWNFPGKSTGVGCHFLLQGIFPTQGSNPGLPHCRQMLYRLSLGLKKKCFM